LLSRRETILMFFRHVNDPAGSLGWSCFLFDVGMAACLTGVFRRLLIPLSLIRLRGFTCPFMAPVSFGNGRRLRRHSDTPPWLNRNASQRLVFHRAAADYAGLRGVGLCIGMNGETAGPKAAVCVYAESKLRASAKGTKTEHIGFRLLPPQLPQPLVARL
jgi:hypothetical protein